jgi:cytochrome c oxidase subunit 2
MAGRNQFGTKEPLRDRIERVWPPTDTELPHCPDNCDQTTFAVQNPAGICRHQSNLCTINGPLHDKHVFGTHIWWLRGAGTAKTGHDRGRSMPGLSRLSATALIFGILLASAGVAWAGLGEPTPWQLGLQQGATPVMDDIVWFHDFLLWVITAITLFVLALLVIVMVKFNARSNPVPSRTTHNTTIEVLWTVVPVLILVAIAVPSFRLLFFQLNIPKADLTIKATGKQWFWSYSYPDTKIEFDSLMVQEKDLKPGQLRLLAVDNEVVVPVNKVVHVLTTGADVIHSFAVPSFGIKIDAIPGRINETWFKAEREGVYYGQCSELCGKDHAFMPITVRVVSEKDYGAWLEQAKKKFATDGSRPTAVATTGAAN